MFELDQLVGSWPALVARLDSTGTLTRWQQLEPTLGAVRSVEDLRKLTAPGSVDPDSFIGALVRLAAIDGGNEVDAVLVVVHLLGNGVRSISRRLQDLAPDMTVMVVSELTAQVRSFPIRRRSRAYAANLLLDTKAALVRELIRPCKEAPIDPLTLTSVPLFDDALAPEAETDLDLMDLFMWAQRTQVASAGELALLLESEQCRVTGASARAELAQRYGVDPRTIRRRKGRTLELLRAAADSYLNSAA